MKIALIHNYYRLAGGEEAVLEAEKLLLEDAGHEVVMFTKSSSDVSEHGLLGGLRLAVQIIYNRRVERELMEFMVRERPDIAHFHNTFPLISPAAYGACRKVGIPVVQTLHNYRLICPAATLSRNELPCNECVSRRVAWPGVLHRCYRSSLPATVAVTLMLAMHRAIGTWTAAVDAYIVLTEFARDRFIEGGLPGDRLVVKPNFVYPDPGPGTHEGGFALFVGRLSRDKGLPTILDAWQGMGGTLPLKIVGAEVSQLDQAVPHREIEGVEWIGTVAHSDLLRMMQDATLLVFASPLHEGMPSAILEAFATGLSVVAADMGGAKSLIEDGRNGVLFEAGDAQALTAAVARVCGDVDARARMGAAARADFLRSHTAARSLDRLLDIYSGAADRADKSSVNHVR